MKHIKGLTRSPGPGRTFNTITYCRDQMRAMFRRAPSWVCSAGCGHTVLVKGGAQTRLFIADVCVSEARNLLISGTTGVTCNCGAALEPKEGPA